MWSMTTSPKKNLTKPEPKKEEKPLTRLQKMQLRAVKMENNDQMRRAEDKEKRLQQYIEGKMLKGHTEEEAIRMADLLIMDRMND